MHVTAPASSANMGAGFDTLGLALDLPFEVVVDDEPGPGFLRAEPGHPAAVAHVGAGGDGELWWRSPIPPGRGLGFSGAAAVAGAFAACGDVDRAFEVAAGLEGHPDNAAPSAHGGFCVSAGGVVIRLAVPAGLETVAWWPDSTTSTKASRAALPGSVPFADATFNVGRAALLVAAMATGRFDALATGVEDRLHQDARFGLMPDSGARAGAMRAAGALAVWLSGSGPTVVALVESGAARRVVEAVEGGGHVRRLGIAVDGVRRLA